MFRLFLFIILISVFPSGRINAQNAEQTLALADELFARQQYESALKYYHRVAFFGGDDLQQQVFPRLAECYFHEGDYESSLFYWNLSVNTTDNDSLKTEYLFSGVLCFYLLEQYDYALQNLLTFDEGDDDFFKRRFHFYHALISMKSDRHEEALSHFVQVVDDQRVRSEIENRFAEVRLDRPNPKTARILSMIIPGSGQLYAGDYRNAVNSFALNGLLLGVTYLVALNYSTIDAVLSVIPWFQRYYMGGFSKVEHIALQRQLEKREDLLSNTLDIIEEHVND